MKKIRAILVDDESRARSVLSMLLATNCPEVELLCSCSDVMEAAEAIKKYQPNLVFLDVQMPDYNGYELIKFVDKINFEIVFVTAFDQYALKAFEVSATDYLLKPVKRERLKEAVQRVSEKLAAQQNFDDYKVLSASLQQRKISQLAISTTEGKYFLKLEEIIAIQGEGAYCKIHLLDEKVIITSKNLKYFEGILSDEEPFFRCHKSWIVNLDFVTKINSTDLGLVANKYLEIKTSKTKRAKLTNLLHNRTQTA